MLAFRDAPLSATDRLLAENGRRTYRNFRADYLRHVADLQENQARKRQRTAIDRSAHLPYLGSPVRSAGAFGELVDKDRTELHAAPVERGSGNPPRSAGIASRVRKASVRAALFQKSQPMRIGRFTLLECIGAGAMGEIYAAYDEQLDRKVALKLVRSGLNRSARADERLLREAQTLARLSHPNVVQVYEAGTYEGGVFIAMEFIRGKTLTAWLEGTQDLPRRQRQREVLRQLIAAGRGLEAAHGAGLAHRDFKPDNVLVGDDGRVRVVDFGLARAVSEDAGAAAASDGDTARGAGVPRGHADALAPTTDAGVPMVTSEATVDMGPGGAGAGASTVVLSSADLALGSDIGPETSSEAARERKAAQRLTATGTVMGTPRYMAPEQIRGQVADHRSDQFSFCVALFHALYGEWPFPGERMGDLMRSVAAGELVLPRRHTDVPAPVRKALLRGLSRDPADRFPSMVELLRALEVWPQRRRRALVALAAAAIMTTGSLAFAALGGSPDPCAGVTGEMDALWNARRKAALAAAFSGSGLSYADTALRSTVALLDGYTGDWRRQARNACEATHVRHAQSAALLDKRMLCLERGKQRLGALLAGFERGGAGAVERAVEAASALPGLAACSDSETLFLGVEPPAQPAVKQSVATVRAHLAEARTHELLGRYDDALRVAEEQLAAAQALPYPPVRAEALHQVGRALARRGGPGDDERAETMYFDALDIAEGERHDQLTVEIWHDLVSLAARYDSSMERGHLWSRRERAAVQRTNAHPEDVARTLRVRGRLHHRDGDYGRAAVLQRRAIEILEGQEHSAPNLGTYYHDLANAEYWSGDYDMAREHFERALAMSIEQLGTEHPKVTSQQYDFATFLLEIEHYDRARALLESALDARTRSQGSESLLVGRMRLILAELEARLGAFDRAHEHRERAVDIYERVLEPGHRFRAEPYMIAGIIALRQHDPAAAREAFESALAIRRRHMDDEHRVVGLTRIRVAESLVELGRHGQAIAHCEAAREAEDETATADFRALLRGSHGRALLGRGSIDQAIEELEQAVALFRQIQGYSWERAATLWALARALRASGRETDRRDRALAEEARAIYEEHGQAGATVHDDIIEWLGEP